MFGMRLLYVINSQSFIFFYGLECYTLSKVPATDVCTYVFLIFLFVLNQSHSFFYAKLSEDYFCLLYIKT